MSWKRFLTACSINLLVSFPQNLIGCASDETDPYDYYVSFYWNEQVDPKGYDPFYYTMGAKWYATTDPVSIEEVNTQSWKQYFNNKPSAGDVGAFIYGSSHKQLADLYQHIDKNNPAFLPADSFGKNSVCNWFIETKDLEALGYIMYAKQVEPYVTGNWDNWSGVNRDSLKMSGLIKNGLQLHKAAKKEEIKLRYAYQLVRLAHYGGRPDDCINYYNLYVRTNTSKHFLKPLCLAQKAGAFWIKGENDSAAYLFSLAFAQSDLKRFSNMQSFEWSRIADSGRTKYLHLCKTNAEKANMLGMFALQTSADENENMKDEINELKTIASLDPACPLLEIITAREINRIEDNYFSAALYRASGRETEYTYNAPGNDERMKTYPGKIKNFETILLSFAANKKIPNNGFYTLAAAHLALIRKDYVTSEALLEKVKDMQLNPKQKDQWNLTRLLITINKQKIIDASFEVSILPQLKWLDDKTKEDESWKKFYRDVFVEILADRYRQQNNIARKALCYSTGYKKTDNPYQAYLFLREQMKSADLVTMNSLQGSKKRTAFEDYLVSNSSFGTNEVKDVIATAFIRENNWIKAEEWLKKIPASYYNNDTYKVYLAANSFADLLYDTHAPTEQDTVRYTKLKFVQKMVRLQKQLTAVTDNNKKAKIQYEIANGLYQMSYWGNSWLLQVYDWSTSERDWAPKKNSWSKEYYGVYHAEEKYKKAFELSSDPEFRARCLFMAAKCYQKQFDLRYENEEKSINAFKEKNSYFSQLIKSYKQTSFYAEAFNTCSYFSDFIEKNKSH